MPARMIRDGLLDSEAVLSLPVEGRWLYVTILLSGDDVGLFEATPFRLARIADVRREHADRLLAMLVDADLVRLYEVAGKRYGFIPKFRQRLQIKRAKCPLPPLALLAGDEDALNKIKDLGSNPPLHNSDSRKNTAAQPPEPEPEPEKKKEIRAEAAPLAPASPAAPIAPAQKKELAPDEIIFGYGVPLLTQAGNTDKAARSFLGKLRKTHGDKAVIDALRQCLRSKPLQPLEWLAKALPPSMPKKTQEQAEQDQRAALVAGMSKKLGFFNLDDIVEGNL